jgi:hypothetical protein
MLSEQSSPLCYECHREHAKDYLECVETAEYFYSAISSLAAETRSLGELIHVVAERGLDVDDLAATVEELDDVLMRSRSQIHAFDRGGFEKLEAHGRERVGKGWQLIAEAEAEYRFRRNGTLVSVAVMFFLVLVIYLKIRQMERRRA